MKDKTRVIEVTKCRVGVCPYCTPDSHRLVNHCTALDDMPRMKSNIKTFPTFCPLKEKS